MPTPMAPKSTSPAISCRCSGLGGIDPLRRHAQRHCTGCGDCFRPRRGSFFQRETDIRVHVSTQASVLNKVTAQRWRDRGVKRIVLAREVALVKAAAIQNDVGVEIETFVHGAMCASFSGKCVISNYTASRDANRGAACKPAAINFPCMQTATANPRPITARRS